MHEFAEFLRMAGLVPSGPVVADGKWRRCPTESHPRRKNGAYKLSPDGRVGWAQDWAVHAEPLTWRPEREADAPVLLDPAAREALRREEREERLKAIRGAREFYAACAPLIGGHPYLEAKGLDMSGCVGLKVDTDGRLVVPMYFGGGLVSVQRIAPDGEKRFWYGAPTSAASYGIERRGAPLTVLCEGLATGLAIYAAAPLARVVVCFNAGNLPRVAERLPRQGMIAVAADNDHGTAERLGRNPGVDAAREAAGLLGCEVAIPEGIEGTDWNDYRQERLAARLAPVYGAPVEREADARRAVDAEILRAMMRAARLAGVRA